MNIRNHRYGSFCEDLMKRLHGFHVGNRHTDDLASRAIHLVNLRQRRRGIPRVGIRHGLNRNRSSAPDSNGTDLNLL